MMIFSETEMTGLPLAAVVGGLVTVTALHLDAQTKSRESSKIGLVGLKSEKY